MPLLTSGPAGPRLLGALALLAAVGAAPAAQAYCRTRTCEFRWDVDCNNDAQECATVGEEVFWGSDCISFAVQRDGSVAQGISAAELEQLVSDGFQAWSDVACPGGTPRLSAGSQGLTACDQVEYNCNERAGNSNVVMFRDEFESGSVGLRFGVIALTTLTANLVTGELFDADIEINSRDEEFVTSGDGGDVRDGPRDLRGVVNHELGHLLGLSHSLEIGALMRAAYEGTFVPGEDDVAGMCDVFEPGSEDPECIVARLPADAVCVGPDTMCTRERSGDGDSDGCACALPGGRERGARRGLAAALGALGAAFWLRRRRRAPA